MAVNVCDPTGENEDILTAKSLSAGKEYLFRMSKPMGGGFICKAGVK